MFSGYTNIKKFSKEIKMCTSIAMKTGAFYFGRNMDIDYCFDEQVVITPRNYPFEFRCTNTLKKHHAIIGMASIADNYPLYAEAANEKGLCVAGLNFPDNAYYTKRESSDKFNIASFELIPWILGKCSCIDEVKKLLGSFGLPGDFSPASRFVKSAYLLANSICSKEENESISQFFHILDSVSVVNGSIEAHPDKPYYTTYSCCINADKGIYYYKTYWNNQISAINMKNENLDGSCLLSFPVLKSQNIRNLN